MPRQLRLLLLLLALPARAEEVAGISVKVDRAVTCTLEDETFPVRAGEPAIRESAPGMHTLTCNGFGVQGRSVTVQVGAGRTTPVFLAFEGLQAPPLPVGVMPPVIDGHWGRWTFGLSLPLLGYEWGMTAHWSFRLGYLDVAFRWYDDPFGNGPWVNLGIVPGVGYQWRMGGRHFLQLGFPQFLEFAW